MTAFSTSLVRRLLLVALALLLTACAGGISGYEGSSEYGCKAPVGVRCKSISGTYANAIQGNLPSQRKAAPSGQSESVPSDTPAPAARNAPVMLATAATLPQQPSQSMTQPAGFAAPPLRSSPRVLRLWIKPWEDADRDLNGESFVYVQVDGGRWLLDHAQRQVRDQYLPVRPGKQSVQKSSQPDPQKGPSASSAIDDSSAIAQALRALQSKSQQPDN